MKPPILFILFLYSFQAQLSFAQTTLNDFEIGKLRGKVKSIIETDRNPNDSLSHYETKTYFNEKGILLATRLLRMEYFSERQHLLTIH